MFLSLERRQARHTAERASQLRLEVELRTRLPLGADDVIRVNEISCGVAGCPDTETVFLLLRPGRRTEAAKVPTCMAGVSAEDLDGVAARFRRLQADWAEVVS